MAKVSIFLIAIALIAGMVGCGGTTTPRYNLTMAVAPGGSGTATDLTNASPYTAGTAVSIKAVAIADYRFVNWTAPAGTFANANAAQTTFTMPAQHVTVTANFVLVYFAGGSGTEGDPYQIADWYQLHIVRNYLDSHSILMNDLNSATAGYTERASPTANEGKGWEPIGTFDDPFTGTFDGQGYEIRDLFINRSEENDVGLFGAVDMGGVIENVGMVDADVTGSLGWCVGGLVGENSGTISDCYCSGSVTGVIFVGGLVGENRGLGTVDSSYATGNVTGGADVGGLVGANEGTVDSSYATGNVTGLGLGEVGGLVGFNNGYVSNSYAIGSVDCSVDGSKFVGGLVGNNWDTVSNSYSTGSVTGADYVGGLVGCNNLGTVNNSFWDTETSGQGTSAGGTGKTTAQMKDFDTFDGAGWGIIAVVDSDDRDTDYVWNIVDDVTYPFLSWQPV